MICFFVFDLVVIAFVFLRKSEPKGLHIDSFLKNLQIVAIGDTKWAFDSLEGSVIVIHFNSECDVCQEEAMQLNQARSKFVNVKLLLVSAETEHAIQEFASFYKFTSENISFARIMNTNAVVDMSLPHAFVFGSNGILLREYKGLTTSTELLSAL